MKTLISLLVLTVCLARVQAQSQNPEAHDGEYYLKLSRQDKATGWVLLGLGTGTMIGGAAVVSKNMFNDITISLWSDGRSSHNTSNSSGGEFLLITGAILAGSSIPVFASAKKHKRMAATLEVSSQSYYIQQNHALTSSIQPALSMKIHF